MPEAAKPQHDALLDLIKSWRAEARAADLMTAAVLLDCADELKHAMDEHSKAFQDVEDDALASQVIRSLWRNDVLLADLRKVLAGPPPPPPNSFVKKGIG